MSKNKEPFKAFGLRWADAIGLDECPYVYRWVLTLFGYALRLHHWVASDDQRHMHDHAWWMLIIVLRGGYTDISEDGRDVLKAGSIRFRRASHKHTVLVDDGGCWSLLITGRPVHSWGFFVAGKKTRLRSIKYFARFGHHPCADKS